MAMTATNRNIPLLLQAAYFFVTGAWSLLHYPSFEAVTGKKTDVWLVRTVGVLVSAIAMAIAYAAYMRREGAQTYLLSYASALGLVAIDAFYSARGTISKVYLLDAIGEVLLLGCIERSRRSLESARHRGVRGRLFRR